MRRRDMLKLSAGAAMLAAPHIAMAQRERTLKFVPIPDLTYAGPGRECEPGITQPRLSSIRHTLRP